MFFGIILTRLLFAASMVFIFGYVFGNFSKSKTLTTITRIASVAAIILFVGSNVFLSRNGGWRDGHAHGRSDCFMWQRDSTFVR